MSALDGFDPRTGRSAGELLPVEAWETDPAAQDAAYEEIKRGWAEGSPVRASERILAAMADGSY